FSGLVNENDLVTLGGYPGELRKALGIWAEEIDALFPDMKNRIVLNEPLGDLSGEYECGLLCDLIHLEGAKVLAVYGTDFYAGRPVLTENSFGKGQTYYIASDPEPAFVQGFLKYLCARKGIKAPLAAVNGVEITQRFKAEHEFTFVLNHNDYEVRVDLQGRCYQDLLSQQEQPGELVLKPKDVAILKRNGE
ncbi:MAG TPA: beta-galactosidase trimerization domain-containing protein, partial [Bacillota bacterium]|nr:beta-galactosidase trimerization domain-containing protein [Bacillota bacterium]